MTTSGRETATPMLADSGTPMPVAVNGSENVVCSRNASDSGLRAVAPLGQDDELVAAEPRHGVAGPDLLAQPLGHLAEQQVAELVAEGVVDHLEAVEVENQQRDPGAGGRAAVEGVGDQPQEQAAVGQPGQVVVVGLPGQGLLR